MPGIAQPLKDGLAYLDGNPPGYVYVGVDQKLVLDGTALKVPYSAGAVVTNEGDMVVDSTPADLAYGLPQIKAGEPIGFVCMPTAEFKTPTDKTVVTYDIATKKFYLAPGASPADPDQSFQINNGGVLGSFGSVSGTEASFPSGIRLREGSTQWGQMIVSSSDFIFQSYGAIPLRFNPAGGGNAEFYTKANFIGGVFDLGNAVGFGGGSGGGSGAMTYMKEADAAVLQSWGTNAPLCFNPDANSVAIGHRLDPLARTLATLDAAIGIGIRARSTDPPNPPPNASVWYQSDGGIPGSNDGDTFIITSNSTGLAKRIKLTDFNAGTTGP